MPTKRIRLLSAATAGGLVLAGVTTAVITNPGHTAPHEALAANLASSPAVNLDNCPTLQEPYTGGCVNQLQTELNADNGTNTPVDGVFGQQTKEAVETFQQNHNLVPVDGIVGPATKAALDSAGSNPATPAAQNTPVPAASNPAPPPATVSGLTPLPGPAAVDSGGTIVCSTAPQIITSLWWNPQVVTDANGNEVAEGVAGIKTFGVGCGDSVEVILQTKVCGDFGCNYHDVASANFTKLPMNGEEIFPALTARLRSGTNRYRLEMIKTTYAYDGDDGPGPGYAGFVPETDTEVSDGVQLTA
jgi:peptidoglycan hydrolase-like protein with peptidoglycan-binding domain